MAADICSAVALALLAAALAAEAALPSSTDGGPLEHVAAMMPSQSSVGGTGSCADDPNSGATKTAVSSPSVVLESSGWRGSGRGAGSGNPGESRLSIPGCTTATAAVELTTHQRSRAHHQKVDLFSLCEGENSLPTSKQHRASRRRHSRLWLDNKQQTELRRSDN